jgi:hypothetical protein
MGNVKLLQDGETVLVPTPSPDPNGMSDKTGVLRAWTDNASQQIL